MKFATIILGGREVLALIDQDKSRYWRLDDLTPQAPASMIEFIANFESLRAGLAPQGEGYDLSEVKFAAPIVRPLRNIFCVGKNYREHATEFARSGYDTSANAASTAGPAFPIIFSKVPDCVIATEEDILYPTGVSQEVDYEAELGVIIGKKGGNIAAADALGHVWGYTIINDVTARDVQARHHQWLLGKSLDTFCPMGPWIATADEIDVTNLELRCWGNDELRQSANTSDLIFDVPTLIETISTGITLQPGDIIATGTPAGVGIGFTPPKFLNKGDQISIEISGLGRLTNRIK